MATTIQTLGKYRIWIGIILLSFISILLLIFGVYTAFFYKSNWLFTKARVIKTTCLPIEFENTKSTSCTVELEYTNMDNKKVTTIINVNENRIIKENEVLNISYNPTDENDVRIETKNFKVAGYIFLVLCVIFGAVAYLMYRNRNKASFQTYEGITGIASSIF